MCIIHFKWQHNTLIYVSGIEWAGKTITPYWDTIIRVVCINVATKVALVMILAKKFGSLRSDTIRTE